MKPIMHIKGPSDAGPGERRDMLDRARKLLEQAGVHDIVRIDVPGRGAEEPGELGSFRPGVEPIVPALQSGSLFGDRLGLNVVDAQALQKAEAEAIVELLGSIDPDAVTVVFVSAGALPAPLAKTVRSMGETVEVAKRRERDANEWLFSEIKRRRLRFEPEAAAVMLRKFGSDTAAAEQALDQLVEMDGTITAAEVERRFSNRPDEPVWYYADAVAAGDVGQALRRLADFLTHGHPLQLLAFLENDLRRRSLAALAPNQETLAEWLGQSAGAYPVKKAWRARSQVSDSSLRRALDALARADKLLKTQPDDVHRLTLERLTVALCHWYGRRGR